MPTDEQVAQALKEHLSSVLGPVDDQQTIIHETRCAFWGNLPVGAWLSANEAAFLEACLDPVSSEKAQREYIGEAEYQML